MTQTLRRVTHGLVVTGGSLMVIGLVATVVLGDRIWEPLPEWLRPLLFWIFLGVGFLAVLVAHPVRRGVVTLAVLSVVAVSTVELIDAESSCWRLPSPTATPPPQGVVMDLAGVPLNGATSLPEMSGVVILIVTEVRDAVGTITGRKTTRTPAKLLDGFQPGTTKELSVLVTRDKDEETLAALTTALVDPLRVEILPAKTDADGTVPTATPVAAPTPAPSVSSGGSPGATPSPAPECTPAT